MNPTLHETDHKGRKSGAKNLVFEIGVEELPATNLADIFSAGGGSLPAGQAGAALSGGETDNILMVKWKKAFQDNRIGFRRAEVWATPRRLVFYLEGVAAAQTAHDQLTKLMAKSEAYGDDGKPSEKFLSILKHRNVAVGETVLEDLNGKPHVFIKKAETVQKTASVLPGLLEAFVPTLAFPKNMKWDDSGLYFPRPIRSTLCFYGAQCLRYKVGNARSGDRTYFFSKGKRSSALVTDAAAYFRVLKKEGVCLDPEERKGTIRSILDKLANSFHGKLYDDPFLLSEVNFLVENPQGLSAPFNDEFLKLPLEVLTVSMARKQRIFGLVDKDRNVLPRFLAIADRPMSDKERKLISLNYENILHAKLQDSLFFYKEDIKVSLEKKREELKNLIFLKGAGSMLQKSDRLAQLCEKSKDSFSLSQADTNALRKAAFLCKADLLTQMVGEFPELQGVIGKYYALEQGQEKEVADAIGEQYLPRTVNDALPQTIPGSVLSILDKADLIGTCFGLGYEPTSSLDPYGLRRSASAILKITLDKKLNFSLFDVIGEVILQLSPIIQVKNAESIREKLDLFFKDRFKALLVDKGYRADVVEACVCGRLERPFEIFLRVQAISQIVEKSSFANARKVVERTHNILKANKEQLPKTADRALFAEPLEHAVMEKLEQNETAIRSATKEGDFEKATSLYAGAFFDILNEFFEKVFINAEDLNVRKNRLSLLRSVKELYTRDIADLSKIQEKF